MAGAVSDGAILTTVALPWRDTSANIQEDGYLNGTTSTVTLAGWETFYFWTAPVAILAGLIGNTLCMALLCRRRLPLSVASRIYLITFLVADHLYLALGAVTWLSDGVGGHLGSPQFLTRLQVALRSDVGCRVTSYVMFTSRLVLEWMLVSLTADAYLVVSRPFRRKDHTTRNAVVVVAVFTAVGLAVGVAVFVGRQAGVDGDGLPACVDNDLGVVLTMASVMLVGMFPPIFLPVLGVCLAAMLAEYERFMRTRKPRKIPKPPLRCRVVLPLILSVVFSVTISPYLAWTIAYLLSRAWGTEGGFTLALTFLEELSHIVLLITSALFTLCVCLAGQVFRAELCAMLCCKKRTVNERSSNRPTLHLTNIASGRPVTISSGRFAESMTQL